MMAAHDIQQQIGRLVMQGADAQDRGDDKLAVNSLKQALSLYEAYNSSMEGMKAPTIIPNNMMAGVYFDYGTLLESTGDLAGACESTGIAARLEPNEPAFVQQYGRYLSRMGRHKEAVKAHETYLRLVPDAEDAAEVRAAINHSRALLNGETQDTQPKVTDSSWPSRYNAAVQLFMTGNIERAKNAFVSLLDEPDLTPVDELMCRGNISQCLLASAGGESLRECVQHLEATDLESLTLHSEAIMALKPQLSVDELSQEAVEIAWKRADSLIIGLASITIKSHRNIEAVSTHKNERTELSPKTGLFGRIFRKKS